jgi:hypothetical protein
MCHKGTRRLTWELKIPMKPLQQEFVDPPAAGSELYKKITTGSHASLYTKETDNS